MADSYSKWVMTTAFANNSQAALNSGGKIEWVSLKTSDDAHQVADLDGFNDTTLATANIKQISGISSVTISGNTVTITGLFNSTNNASDYYIRTIFLVAKYNGKEFLAGTTVANTSGSAFRMPASSDTEITEFTARPQISVTNTNSISTTVDPVASATNERVDSLEATLQGEIDDINVDKQNLWNKLADYVTKAAAETITGVKTFSQTIVGSITGNAGTATKLQTERTIGFSGDVNGTAQSFDGSKNITLPINLNSINQNNTTSMQSAGYNSPVTIIDGITRDTKGRVTGVNTKTVTLPPVQTTISGNAASATKLETARLIGGVSFDGTSDIILPGVNSIGNQNTTGNAATATNANLATKAVALQTPRKINGTNFDGTADINVNAANDNNLVHRTGDENIAGNKNFSDKATFNKTIAGALETRLAPFNDFNEAATHLQDYQGKWRGGHDSIKNTPELGWFIVDVQTWGDGNNLGHLILRYTDHNAVWVGLAVSGKISWEKLASDDAVMHLWFDEVVNGSKNFKNTATFEKPINGSFSISQALFTDFADVAKNMNTYSGKWFVSADQTILNSPLNNSVYLVEVIPANATVSGKIILTPYDASWDGSIYYSIINWKGLSEWRKIAQDSQVLHLSGDETASGFKKFSGNIATTSDNSMINGGGNNGDLAMVKTAGSPAYLAIGNFNQRFIVRQSNNAAVSPSDTFQDMFTVNVDGTVKAGTQQDLVPLDKNVAHNSGNETLSGNKTFSDTVTFNKKINGNIQINAYPLTTLQELATKMNTYSGEWVGGSKLITDMPEPGYANISVKPYGNSETAGTIILTYTESNRSFISYAKNPLSWLKISDDATVVHNTGTEDILGSKNFKNPVTTAGIEVMAGTPFVDFHFGNDSGDYTSRIAEYVKGELNINSVKLSGGTISGTLNGNASSSTKLQTPRNINGVGFDGTSDITVNPVVQYINTETDVFTLSNGFYYFNGVVAANKPAAATNWFTVEVMQTETDGFMRLVDNLGLSFWNKKSGSTWSSWRQDADDSTVVHKDNDETLTGNKNFSGVATFAKAQTSSTIKKTITTNAPISLNFAETAFGVMVYASASGTFTADSTWKTLATLPPEISAPVQIVTLNDVDWAGAGGVTNRMGVGLKIAIKPNREITYKVTSLKENDNTTYNVGTTFDTSTYWSK
ncbi:hypothetical protein [Leuconostoc lactis]|uniref:hypothetical protein n=1 Tax=Leuconostoc lactis TaxID=1246 RepID=UPI00241FBF26|nr:hypothetical protein [Leuconostoc lactis]